MLCDVCYRMLRGQDGRQWRGKFDLQFVHHLSLPGLEKSTKSGCPICRFIFDESQAPIYLNLYTAIKGVLSHISALAPRRWLEKPKPKPSPTIATAQRSITRAAISRVPASNGLFRLKFTRQDTDRVKILVLKCLGPFHYSNKFCPWRRELTAHEVDISIPSLYTPIPGNTALDEIVHLARKWIGQCVESHVSCNVNFDDGCNTWHPTRLIDIQPVHLIDIDPRRPMKFHNETPIWLVSTENWTSKRRYVTLSHCWGQAQILRLVDENEHMFFTEGIRFGQLPLAFRDVVLFSSRLGVRYIWIDSLCIKQGNASDWMHESSQMHKVYSQSFCNLSATAAHDSSVGLFFNRRVNPLWESEVNLCTDGIPEVGPYTERIPASSKAKAVQTCAVIDPLFWEHRIDNAVLNTRGWVLQERLMAPRVLHFCEDQIAWECQEHDAAECYPDGLPSLKLRESTRGQVVSRERMKGLNQMVDGKALRTTRFRNEPLAHLIPDLYAFELWKRVVEVYSKARLTNPEDILVALSGIAKLIADKIGSRYVAGMWEKNLASQLLWRVEPSFTDGKFSYLST